jgi:hypothetical protein
MDKDISFATWGAFSQILGKEQIFCQSTVF